MVVSRYHIESLESEEYFPPGDAIMKSSYGVTVATIGPSSLAVLSVCLHLITNESEALLKADGNIG